MLPAELIEHICSFASLASLLRLSLVSHSVRAAAFTQLLQPHMLIASSSFMTWLYEVLDEPHYDELVSRKRMVKLRVVWKYAWPALREVIVECVRDKADMTGVSWPHWSEVLQSMEQSMEQ